MKIPKKRELLELQKKYRTDRKIGEVYGVPGRLVAYWRSKKGIPAYSQPKYSKETILELWERHGNDRLAGAELDITGPAFRQWRLKFNIKAKPPQLKYKQLELPLLEISRRGRNSRKETLIQKIVARKAGLKYIDEKEVVEITPDLAVCGDEALEVLDLFRKMGASKILDKNKLAVILDCPSFAGLEGQESSQKTLRDWARKQGVENLHDYGAGVPHHVIGDLGLVMPGDFVFGTNPYISACGGIGAVGIPVKPAEMVAVWALGRLWYRIPPTVKVVLCGKIPRGLTSADLSLRLEHDLSSHIVAGKAIEISGESLTLVSLAARISLASPIFHPRGAAINIAIDDVAIKGLRKLYRRKFTPIQADTDARYADEIEINVGYLTPLVAALDKDQSSGKPRIRAAEELAGKKIDTVIIGGCHGGNVDDLMMAAGILRGYRTSRDVQTIIIPGSRKTYLDAVEKGYIRVFIESGCVVTNPGCSFGRWPVTNNDRVISTSICARGGAEHYISSAATAAATAIDGAITDPRKYLL